MNFRIRLLTGLSAIVAAGGLVAFAAGAAPAAATTRAHAVTLHAGLALATPTLAPTTTPSQEGTDQTGGPDLQGGSGPQGGPDLQGGSGLQGGPDVQGGPDLQGGSNVQAGPDLQQGGPDVAESTAPGTETSTGSA